MIFLNSLQPGLFSNSIKMAHHKAFQAKMDDCWSKAPPFEKNMDRALPSSQQVPLDFFGSTLSNWMLSKNPQTNKDTKPPLAAQLPHVIVGAWAHSPGENFTWQQKGTAFTALALCVQTTTKTSPHSPTVICDGF